MIGETRVARIRAIRCIDDRLRAADRALEIADGGYLYVRVRVADSIDARLLLDTGAGYNMLMLQPEYMKRLEITADTRARGPLEYYVHSTFLPELHYCEAPKVRVPREFVGFKEGLIYEGLVGHGALRGRRLTIDIPERRMLAW